MSLRKVAVALAALVSLSACSGGGISSGLNVSIEATPELGAYPLAVTFKATLDGQEITDTGASFEWDFGDSTSSTEASPAHTFQAIGEYQVTLTLAVNGKAGGATKTITVAETGPGTDLAVESVEFTPPSVNPGSPITVKVTLRNRGETGVESNFINRVYITTAETLDVANETPRGSINVPGIPGSTSLDKSTTITLPSAFSLADYNVFVVTDAADTIDEIDETNNIGVSITKLQVTSATLPIDLSPSVPTVSSVLGSAGTQVVVSTTVSNNGGAEAGSFTLKVMLSADPTVDPDDYTLHSTTIAGILGNATSQQDMTITIPASIDNRPWYLGVLVDTGSEVPETDEANNAAQLSGLFTTAGGTGCTEDANEPNDVDTLATTITPGTLAAMKVCGPTVDWYKVSVGLGDRLSSVINFQNVNGDLDLEVYKMGSMTPVDVSDTTGNTEEVDTGIAYAASEYLVKVMMGGNTAGNAYDLVTSLQDNGGPGIDLMPTEMMVGTPGMPVAPGATTSASVKLWNFGDVAATAFSVELYLSTDKTLAAGDTLLDTFNVPALMAGTNAEASRSITIPAGTTQGWYYVIAKTDAGAAQTEAHENNNELAYKLGIGSGCIDDTYEPNDTIATSSVMDNGTFADLYICQGGEPTGDVYAVTTGANGTIMASITGLTSDLDMKIVTSSGSAPAGCTAPNKCSSTSGGSAAENVQYTATAGGTFYIKVFGYGSATGPYTLAISGSTGSMPDFAPNTIVASPMTVTAGEEIQVDGKIKNNSTQATAGFEWTIRLSSDTTIDAGDLLLGTFTSTGLNAGENRAISEKVTVPMSAPGGQFYVGVFADSAGTVAESTESNNSATTVSKVTVLALCNDDMFEDNDTSSAASAMAVGANTTNLVVCGMDQDWYAFTPTTNGTLAIHVGFTHAADKDIDAKLYLSGTQVGSSVSVNDDEDISLTVTAGQTYRLKVYGFSGSTPFTRNDYTLSTTLTP